MKNLRGGKSIVASMAKSPVAADEYKKGKLSEQYMYHMISLKFVKFAIISCVHLSYLISSAFSLPVLTVFMCQSWGKNMHRCKA